jgi:hypothetical protein
LLLLLLLLLLPPPPQPMLLLQLTLLSRMTSSTKTALCFAILGGDGEKRASVKFCPAVCLCIVPV